MNFFKQNQSPANRAVASTVEIPRELLDKLMIQFVRSVADGKRVSYEGRQLLTNAFGLARRQGSESSLVARINDAFGLYGCLVRIGLVPSCDRSRGKTDFTIIIVDARPDAICQIHAYPVPSHDEEAAA